MKTFLRKLFNLRTDAELAGILYVNYKDGHICSALARLQYRDVLTDKEHKRLYGLVQEHLEGCNFASSWCVKKGFAPEDWPVDAHSQLRKIFLASLYEKLSKAEK